MFDLLENERLYAAMPDHGDGSGGDDPPPPDDDDDK